MQAVTLLGGANMMLSTCCIFRVWVLIEVGFSLFGGYRRVQAVCEGLKLETNREAAGNVHAMPGRGAGRFGGVLNYFCIIGSSGGPKTAPVTYASENKSEIN